MLNRFQYPHRISLVKASPADLAKKIHSLIPQAPPLQLEYKDYASFSKQKYEDVRRRIPHTEKCQRILGFVPTTPLTEGLMKTIEWHMQERT